MIARVGDDDAGREVRVTLDRFGVDTTLVLTAPGAPTGTAAITVAGGENSIVVVPGANHVWPTAGPDEPATAALAGAGVVLAQLEIPIGIAATGATAAGLFVLNASPAVPLPDDLLARCAVLVVNEHELATVVGAAVHDVPGAHRALLARGAGAVVTTLGARGAVVTDTAGDTSVESLRPTSSTPLAPVTRSPACCARSWRRGCRSRTPHAGRWRGVLGGAQRGHRRFVRRPRHPRPADGR